MADGTLLMASRPQPMADPVPQEQHLQTILHVQWALAIACAYLVLFGRESGDPDGLGPLVVAGFLAVNLLVGRIRPATTTTPLFGIGLAAIDSLLIVLSLYVANQLSIELILMCLGVLILAIAGLRTGPIALATLALTLLYLAIVWFTGGISLWRSSVLLRVPLLFTAAIVYAWLVEIGSRGAAARVAATGSDPADALLDEVVTQWDAIQRCQSALREGARASADEALREIAAQNQAIRMRANALR
jgi:hypothetical protein